MSGVRSLYRGATVKGYASAGSAPIRIDPNTNTVKIVPIGSGSTEVEQADVSTAQTLTNKTLTAPALTSPVITGTPNINVLKSAFSTASVSSSYSSDTYLAGSGIAMPTGGFTAGMAYYLSFDVTKTAAGTAAFTVTLRIGTAAATSDAAILTFTFGAGTAAADTGIFDLVAYFRTVGATTTAVMVGNLECSHNLAATGIISTGASGYGSLQVVSSGFDSTVAATTIGVSINGGASFVGSNTFVKALLVGF